MGFYVKKPVVIEAIQILEENFEELEEFAKDCIKFVCRVNGRDPVWLNCKAIEKHMGSGDEVQVEQLVIHTLEGLMAAYIGDFLIRGVKGEFYSCRKEIFEETYDPVYLETEME